MAAVLGLLLTNQPALLSVVPLSFACRVGCFAGRFQLAFGRREGDVGFLKFVPGTLAARLSSLELLLRKTEIGSRGLQFCDPPAQLLRFFGRLCARDFEAIPRLKARLELRGPRLQSAQSLQPLSHPFMTSGIVTFR